MSGLDITYLSSLPGGSPSTVRLSRRRFVLLLAASSGAFAALPGCGGDEQSTPGGYNFPGARKDETGNYKMRNI